MKIKISKSQWEFLGKKAGWIKVSQDMKSLGVFDMGGKHEEKWYVAIMPNERYQGLGKTDQKQDVAILSTSPNHWQFSKLTERYEITVLTQPPQDFSSGGNQGMYYGATQSDINKENQIFEEIKKRTGKDLIKFPSVNPYG
jgi:hypothetical protein